MLGKPEKAVEPIYKQLRTKNITLDDPSNFYSKTIAGIIKKIFPVLLYSSLMGNIKKQKTVLEIVYGRETEAQALANS